MFQNEWTPLLKHEFEQDYFKKLAKFVHEEYETKTIFPPKAWVFSSFEHTNLKDVKVVILGQDPYHQPNQAHGMCFSVQKGVKIPPSLVNIYKEINSDLGLPIPNHGFLMHWAKQGVLLLNTVLTVEYNKAFSHRGMGWEVFTDNILKILNEQDQPIVFLLWGKPAQQKMKFLNNPKHLVLTAAHPSPLSAYNGFFGCKHFSKTNNFLVQQGCTPIDWRV